MAPSQSKSSAGLADSVTDRRRKANDVDSAWKSAKKELNAFIDENPEILFVALQNVKNLKGAKMPSPVKKIKGQGILGTPVSEEPWPETYHVHKKVPKYWLAHWVYGEVSQSVSPELMNAVDAKDGSAIRKFHEIGTGVSQHHSCPRVLHDKPVMSRFYTWRHRQLGSRLIWIFQNCVDAEGNVDWDKVVVYNWVQDPNNPEFAKGVRHYSGVEAPISEGSCPKMSWAIWENYRDSAAWTAASETSLNKPLVKNFFVEAGLLKDLFDIIDPKNQTEQATRFQKQLEAMKANLTKGTVHADVEALAGVAQPKKKRAVAPPPAGDPGQMSSAMPVLSAP